MRRVFLLGDFVIEAKAAGVKTEALLEALRLVDGGAGTPFGSSIVKVRVARHKGGKSSGYRVLHLHRAPPGNVFFLHLFAKNDHVNIKPVELDAWRGFAKTLGRMDDRDIDRLLADESLVEIIENA